ncbi:hypothetical protein ABW21_db0209924 [Orbilia brochopaga]|nr:hypothetical protein ABW21_db0209924 [Drechslerella brochopaga]
MMTVYKCASDLEIGCLMEWVIYTVVLETGRWEAVMCDPRMLSSLLGEIFTLTGMEDRAGGVYRRFFALLAAVVQQRGLIREPWFFNLVSAHPALGQELLRATLLGEDGTGRLGCFRDGCTGIIGEWRKCQSCVAPLNLWDADSEFDEW